MAIFLINLSLGLISHATYCGTALLAVAAPPLIVLYTLNLCEREEVDWQLIPMFLNVSHLSRRLMLNM